MNFWRKFFGRKSMTMVESKDPTTSDAATTTSIVHADEDVVESVGPTTSDVAITTSVVSDSDMAEWKYDVALSFAGEDREYVEAVAEALRVNRIRVFYDRYEEASLWGKDLYSHLSQIYGQDARFTVIFISRHYAAKLWTNHERKSAQARAFEEHQEYILPARFDDSDVPGILRTTGYVDLRQKTPAMIGELLVEKLKSIATSSPMAPHMLVPHDYEALEQIAAQGYAVFSMGIRTGGKYSRVHIAVDPTQYLRLRDLLDDLFQNYLVSYVDAFTYGSQWIILGEPFHTRLFVPLEWVTRTGEPIHKLAPQWMSTPPGELGLNAGQRFEIVATTELDRGLEGGRLGPIFVLACQDTQLWDIVTTEAKAIALLRDESVVKKAPIASVTRSSHRFVGVFRDWLSIGGSCAWVETGAQPSEWILRWFAERRGA